MKQKKKIEPLLKHKMVLDKMLGKGGNKPMSLGKAMREVGYKENYADNPQRLTQTDSWETLIEKHLPDSSLTKKHEELLNARQVEYFVFPKKMKDEEIEDKVNSAGLKVIVIREAVMGKMAFYSIDNSKAKKDALDMAYKLKSKYAPEEHNLKFKGFSKTQLIDAIMGKIVKKK